MQKVFVVLFFVILSLSNFAQIPVGEWRDHLSHNQGTLVAVAEERVYCATERGLFYYDTEDNSLNNISPITTLSDLDITHLKYHKDAKALIVGYENGNIDLFYGDKKVNIPSIKLKNFIGSKSINNSFFYKDKLLVSTGFGVIELNLEKKEVGDSYIFGENEYLNISSIIPFTDSLFAFTNKGIFKIEENHPFPENFQNWTLMPGTDAFDYRNAELFNNQLVLNVFDPSEKSFSVLAYFKQGWDTICSRESFVRNIKAENRILLVTQDFGVKKFDINLGPHRVEDSSKNFYDAFYADTYVWIADYKAGLLKANDKFEILDTLKPNSPLSNQVFLLKQNNGNVYSTTGSYNHNYFVPEISVLNQNQWRSFSRVNISAFTGVSDIVDFAFSSSGNDLWLASDGYGLVHIEKSLKSKRYTIENTDNLDSSFFGGICFDQSENLWFTFRPTAKKKIGVRKADGSWHTLNHFATDKLSYPERIIETSWGDLWVVVDNSSYKLYCLDYANTPEVESDDEAYMLKLIDDEGHVFGQSVNDIAEDKDGTLWVATDDGVLTIDNPRSVEKKMYVRARRPQLIKFGNILKSLLTGEIVSCIAVDGANRKWFGTRGGGLFLVSADGTEEVFNFNSSNSPLYSDNINSIAIDEHTGEVFVGTDKGILSFMGTASEGKSDYSQIKAYPNPVRPGYTGIITIDGLTYQSEVRITDLAGNLVYYTQSNGGKAVWNGKDQFGNPVVSGTYLVLVAGPDREQAEVTKILIVR